MVNHHVICRRRHLAHWTADIIGTSIGLLLFGIGMRGLFSVGANDTWITITAGVSGTLTLLPLSILGIFKPRIAAYGVIATWVIFLASFFGSVHLGEMEASASGILWLLLLFLALPSTIAGLFYYASTCDASLAQPARGDQNVSKSATPKSSSSLLHGTFISALDVFAVAGRKRKAQWAAVVVGMVAGAWRLLSAVSPLMRSIRAEDWMGVVYIIATTLILLPLGILAIFKPRQAAYAAAVSLAVALAYPLAQSLPEQRLSAEFLGGVLLYSLFNVPLVLIVGLLLYATSGRDQLCQP